MRREYSSAHTVLSAVATMQDCLDHEALPGLKKVNDRMAQMLVQFGMAELHFRERDRLELADNKAAAAIAAARAEKLHESAFRALARARSQLVTLGSVIQDQIEGAIPDTPPKEVLKIVSSELRAGLAGIEMRPGDMKELLAGLDEAAQAGASSNGPEFINFFDNALTQLEKLRSSPGRGAETNLAPWKFWAVVAVVGIWIAGAVLLCIFLAPSCPAWVALTVGSLGVVAATIREFC